MSALINTPTQSEFRLFQKLIEQKSGIYLPEHKIHLLHGRLSKRLRTHDLRSFKDYYKHITSAENRTELQTAIDLITTNETYFFREPKHFDFIKDLNLDKSHAHREFKVWSAASSTGEEPYSIAMTIAATGIKHWSLMASDININVLETARKGIYAESKTDRVPLSYRNEYCRTGLGAFKGQMRMSPELRAKIDFRQINLVEDIPHNEVFDMIFLRNVMIYFTTDTQRRIVLNLKKHLKPGAYLFIGHSETLKGINDELVSCQPAVYKNSEGYH